MPKCKWLRAFHIGLTIIYEILSFPFKLLFGVIDLVDTLKS